MNELGGIALAALSGITILAYKDPQAYAKLFLLLAIILSAVEIGVIIWDMGIENAYNAALPYVASEKLGEAYNAIIGQTLRVRFPYLTYMLSGLIFYVIFLRRLFLFR